MRRGVLVVAVLAAACRPSFEKASKDAHDFDAKNHDAAVARLEADRSLVAFAPVRRDVPADTARPAGKCLFDVTGEIGFDEGACPGEHRFYRRGDHVVVACLAPIVEDESDYEDSHCLRSGLGGGANMAGDAVTAAGGPPAPPPLALTMLGVSSADRVALQDVEYRVHVVSKTCTGSYETLGYPP